LFLPLLLFAGEGWGEGLLLLGGAGLQKKKQEGPHPTLSREGRERAKKEAE
jgi:hypothetical protein